MTRYRIRASLLAGIIVLGLIAKGNSFGVFVEGVFSTRAEDGSGQREVGQGFRFNLSSIIKHLNLKVFVIVFAKKPKTPPNNLDFQLPDPGSGLLVRKNRMQVFILFGQRVHLSIGLANLELLKYYL
jgi:hypothetical protein